jgi:lantibiotic leader peptide-processing serine protease
MELLVAIFGKHTKKSKIEKQVNKAGGTLLHLLPEVGIALIGTYDPAFSDNLRKGKVVEELGGLAYHLLSEPQITPAPSTSNDIALPTAEDTAYASAQWSIRRVGADAAWTVTSGSHDTVVAVLDTGVADDHPDLAPNLVHKACFSMGSLSGTGSCSVYPDIHWHGTHAAGLVGGAFGGGTTVGVGPNLGLASYNVFELIRLADGTPRVVAYDYAIWAALIDAANRGYSVANMSFGSAFDIKETTEGKLTWKAWKRVSKYAAKKDVLMVAAAGNDGLLLEGNFKHVPSDLPKVVAVGASGIRPAPIFPQPGVYDERTYYSNHGESIDLLAPGGDWGLSGSGYPGYKYLIYGPYAGVWPGCAATRTCTIGYVYTAGTSMAAPHVAGAAGLLRDAKPWLSAKKVSKLLKKNAIPVAPDSENGAGVVDVAAALGL